MNVPILQKLNENKEFIYAVALILLIPTAFVVNTYLFVQGLNRAFETELTGKANLTTNVLSSTLKESIGNKEKLSSLIDEVVQNSPEIEGLTVISFENGLPVVLATNEDDQALSTDTVLLTKLAWATGQPYTTKLDVLNEEGKTFRLWQVSLPVIKNAVKTETKDPKEEKSETSSKEESQTETVAVINLKVSGEKSD